MPVSKKGNAKGSSKGTQKNGNKLPKRGSLIQDPAMNEYKIVLQKTKQEFSLKKQKEENRHIEAEWAAQAAAAAAAAAAESERLENERKRIADTYQHNENMTKLENKHEEAMMELKLKEQQQFYDFITKEQELYIKFSETIPWLEIKREQMDALINARNKTIEVLTSRVSAIDRDIKELEEKRTEEIKNGNVTAYAEINESISERRVNLKENQNKLNEFMDSSWKDLEDLKMEIPSPAEFCNLGAQQKLLISGGNNQYIESK